MKKRDNGEKERPSFEDVNLEFERINSKDKKKRDLRRTLGFLIVVAAIAVLISLMCMPVFKADGYSMSPTIENGDILVGFKYTEIEKGDVIAFSYNNSVLIKRVIGTEGDVINIDVDGKVYVNEVEIQEDYLAKKSYGSDVTTVFPYQVPVNSVFLLGDNREDSIDSRSKNIGGIPKTLIIGEIKLRVWPF